jgi:hypothetical protein
VGATPLYAPNTKIKTQVAISPLLLLVIDTNARVSGSNLRYTPLAFDRNLPVGDRYAPCVPLIVFLALPPIHRSMPTTSAAYS